MVTGVSEKERGREREREREKKKIIITFHSVTKKRIVLFKTKYLLKMASFPLGNKTFTHQSQRKNTQVSQTTKNFKLGS